MAAITANLLAAAAPPLNPTVNSAAQTGASTQPVSRSGFADVLTQATTRPPTAPPTPASPDTPTATEPLTESGEDPDLVATALAALGLIQQPLPNQLPVIPPTSIPASAIAASVTATAQTIATTADIAAETTPPTLTPVAPTTSRTEQLRFEAAPAARGTPNTQAVPTSLSSTVPTATTGEVSRPLPTPQASSVLPVVPAIPTNTTVAAAPSDVIPAAARTPAVVAQVPLVAERSQQLPALPPELGYSLVGPTVDGPQAVNPVLAVGGTPSQGQVEVRAAGLPPVEPPAPMPDIQPPQPGQSFGDVFTNRATPVAPANVPTTPVVTPTTTGVPQPTVTPTADTQPTRTRPTDTRPVGTQPTSTPLTASTPPSNVPPAIQPAATQTANSPRVSTPSSHVPTPAGEVDAVVVHRPVTAERPFAPMGDTLTPESTDGQPPPLAIPAPAEQAVVESPLPSSATTVFSAQSRPVEPSPADSPRVNPTASPVAAQLQDAFVIQARVIERGGRHEFQLRLDPPELGEVKVRVLAMGDKIEARLVVSDDAVRKLIESQLPDLRQRLEQAGVSVPKFDVTTDGGRANTGGDAWDRHHSPATPRTATPTAAPTARPAPAAGGLLDVTA